jgi:DNA-binding transcriptional LysR family regulator
VGLGVSLVPSTAAQLSMSGVVYAELDPPVRQLEFAVAYRKDATNPAIHRFLEVLRRTLPA